MIEVGFSAGQLAPSVTLLLLFLRIISLEFSSDANIQNSQRLSFLGFFFFFFWHLFSLYGLRAPQLASDTF